MRIVFPFSGAIINTGLQPGVGGHESLSAVLTAFPEKPLKRFTVHTPRSYTALKRGVNGCVLDPSILTAPQP